MKKKDDENPYMRIDYREQSCNFFPYTLSLLLNSFPSLQLGLVSSVVDFDLWLLFASDFGRLDVSVSTLLSFLASLACKYSGLFAVGSIAPSES